MVEKGKMGGGKYTARMSQGCTMANPDWCMKPTAACHKGKQEQRRANDFI
jgi:hypothetical protein